MRMADVLERGNIYFACRPKVEHTSAAGLEDVQRFFVILSPFGSERHRLIVIGRKKLPAIAGDQEQNWGFVQKVGREPEEIEELNIPREGSYIVTVKNPEVDAPPGAGLPEDARPDLPQRLRRRFHGRRFIPVDPPEFLDREGTELVLIGADEHVFEELGVRLDPERETIDTAELFNELRMERAAHPLKPRFEGRWQ